MMRLKSIFTGFLCLVFLSASGQKENFFSDNPEVFISQVENLFRQTDNKRLIDQSDGMLSSLKILWNQNRFSTSEQIAIYSTATKMHEEKLKTYPHFYNYFSLINAIGKSKQSQNSFLVLNEYTYRLLERKKLKEFDELLQKTTELFTLEKIAGKGTTSWYIRQSVFSFVLDSALLIDVEKADLVCATSRDSSVIHQTQGYFDITNNQWKGRGGTVNWWRFGFDSNIVSVELSNYEVDLTRSFYRADSAVFRNKEYFSFPILGSFQDQVFNSPPSQRTSHPRFNSYLFDYEVPDIFPGVNLNGGVAMEGATLIGSGSDMLKASLTFYRNKQKVAKVVSGSFILNSRRLQSEKVAATFYLDNDSIFHPGVWFRFDEPSRRLLLTRSQQGIADGPFINSYHELDMYIEAVYWNIDEDEVQFKEMEGLGTTSRGWAESSNYFEVGEWQKLQGIDEFNPLDVLDDYIKKFGVEDEIKVSFLADYMRKPREQVIAQLLRLASRGFLYYNEETQSAYINQRFKTVVDAKAGKADFDVIKFNTTTSAKQSNMVLNLKSFDLKINGIEEIILSKTQGVELFPDESQIVVKKNRDFIFTGIVKAGLFDFFAREGSFEYENFKLNFSYVDSLSFLVKLREQKANDIKPQYVRVKNVLSDLTGTLFIDEPFNKSGLKNTPRFPVFNSKSECYVYFDNLEVQSGSLVRDRFYYVIDPFEIDSLDNFSTDNLRFDGYLTSGIFPVFREPLSVMKDYSLGFDHKIPEEGYAMFENKGRYFNSIHLSNEGFKGLGRLDYLTSIAFAKDFVFYLDSVKATLDQIEMKEKEIATEFPKGESESIAFHWNVDSNIVALTTLNNPYNLFENATFHGILEISPTGMTGDGKLEFGKAIVQSGYFSFLSKAFQADTADFRLFPNTGNKEAFKADDYTTFIDFRNRSGNFRYVDQNSKLSFPFNQYFCTLDEAIWHIDDNRISLNNRRIDNIYDFKNKSLSDLIDLDLRGSEFISEHPDQDSLSFFCLEANYDLVEYAIVAHDVKIIRVADAAIFPNDGIVTILKDADMKPLQSATIIADTNNKFHQFFDSKVNIYSRLNYRASGNYTYVNVQNETTIIHFKDIGVGPEGKSIAFGNVEPTKNFLLNPWFGFTGEIHLAAGRRLLQFKGGFSLAQTCDEGAKPWIAFDSIVDPLNVRLPVKERNIDINGNKINNGLFFTAVTDNYHVAFLQFPRSPADKEIASVNGNIWYDKATASYKIENNSTSNQKAFLHFNTTRCVIMGKAKMDLDLRLPAIDLKTIGSFEYKMIPDSVDFNLFVSLSFFFDDKLLTMMADSLNAANLPGVSINQGNYLTALSYLINTDESDRILNEIALYGAPRRVPEPFHKSMVISDIKMKWNPESRSFISYGPIGIANINKTQVNKFTEGFFEIEKSRSGDGFTIYLMLNAKQWFFFGFKGGIMQALSSSDYFNTELMKIKQDKRVLSDPASGGRYEYIISTRRKMVDFLRKIQSVDL
ncbi:MAG: hypothetical protein CVT92_11820 [Bacteroidetes bacterium HGW-Bacteroidetes-1]|jgi:hypothetical protein|nr:MAG: hypothetical protein CVT92_11820 [Bacteroidetes bacterium HGW-Bacteroidetes-1]